MSNHSSGIFSSKAFTNTTNEVLISGRDCGTIPTNTSYRSTFTESNALYENQKINGFFAYATECYGQPDVQRTERCETFVRPTLPYKSDRNASCPFAEEMCKSSSDNLLIDSGKLDSSDHLGLNKGPRFTVRYQSHCAPLKTHGFTEVVTEPDSLRRFQVYKYGSIDNQSFIYRSELDEKKIIFAYESGEYKVT